MEGEEPQRAAEYRNFVNDYYTTAQENEKRMQGFDVDDAPVPQAAVPTEVPAVTDTAATSIVNVPQE